MTTTNWSLRLLLLSILCCCPLTGCNTAPNLTPDQWIGIYATPAEQLGFASTVLAIERNESGRLTCREHSTSDFELSNKIKQDEQQGDCLTDGNRIYIATAVGFAADKLNPKPYLLGNLQRYTRVMIRGHPVLLDDDAAAEFNRGEALEKISMLIKVSDSPNNADGFGRELSGVDFPSLSLIDGKTRPPRPVLYDDPSR